MPWLVSDYIGEPALTTLEGIRNIEGSEDNEIFPAIKISSDIDDLVIHMKRSPKVINIIKSSAPAPLLSVSSS